MGRDYTDGPGTAGNAIRKCPIGCPKNTNQCWVKNPEQRRPQTHPDRNLKSRRVKECGLHKVAQDGLPCTLYSMGVYGKGPQLSSRAGLRAARVKITISGINHRLIYLYTGCPGRNVPDFGRMFLKLK